MAKTKAVTAPGVDHNWQAESDKDSILRAAEVVADRIRFRAAMKKMAAQKKGIDKMLGVLARK